VRGIQGEIPEDFRFSPQCKHGALDAFKPAILVPSRNEKGTIVALNRIFLNEDGTKLKATDKNGHKVASKLGLGAVKHGSISIQKNEQSDRCFITEGTEDALTIKQVNSIDNIKCNIGIGQLPNIKFEPHIKTVVIVADNDGIHPSTKGALIRAVDEFLKQGLKVELVVPEHLQMNAKVDANDVLKSPNGVENLKQLLANRVDVQSTKNMGDKHEAIGETFGRLKSSQTERQKDSSKPFSLSPIKSPQLRVKNQMNLER